MHTENFNQVTKKKKTSFSHGPAKFRHKFCKQKQTHTTHTHIHNQQSSLKSKYNNINAYSFMGKSVEILPLCLLILSAESSFWEFMLPTWIVAVCKICPFFLSLNNNYVFLFLYILLIQAIPYSLFLIW